jgi:LmbE family N-acetylglucosaminyl deacetylase
MLSDPELGDETMFLAATCLLSLFRGISVRYACCTGGESREVAAAIFVDVPGATLKLVPRMICAAAL